MSRIVVAWSPDDYGRAALVHAVAEARLRGLGLLVVNASRGDALVDDRFATDDDLAGVRAELDEAGLAYDVRQSVGADVGDQVLEAAAEVDAALIVLGLRRRTPVGKLIMGSVAQRILLGAHCPVLAVKSA
ncbi:universal stress protein [Nocardioides sp. MAH-18]|uniref:Universal stress protein n=1 Tax=Nocardioides agri TaxID=2682843 RepID=A0A6L6XLA4_9ACTN|nr:MULTISPECIES: universal stress protein [unclassified Nocardioides]MBA2953150.1 universal stress protein [Nocardioides sp. CGMCC 1.13656]MVQ48019.1 universal stress protein [Nocardioides sp. MAH-18]